jgi:hypothetical protein
MKHPLMPKATASWLVDQTSLTFEQIASFCGLHVLEVQMIADQNLSKQIVPMDPVRLGQLTWEEIHRCEKDSSLSLQIQKISVLEILSPKKSKYTPLSKRQDRPDGIAWLLRQYPHLTDQAISKFLGTTRATVQSIRNKTHWNFPNLKPRNPVFLGLRTQIEFEKFLQDCPAPPSAESRP